MFIKNTIDSLFPCLYTLLILVINIYGLLSLFFRFCGPLLSPVKLYRDFVFLFFVVAIA